MENMENQNNVNNEKMDTHKEGSSGPIVGSVIIIILIIVGGLYFWGNSIDRTSVDENATPEEILATEDEQLNNLENQENSDEISSIESDLDDSDFSELDKETSNIEAELETF